MKSNSQSTRIEIAQPYSKHTPTKHILNHIEIINRNRVENWTLGETLKLDVLFPLNPIESASETLNQALIQIPN